VSDVLQTTPIIDMDAHVTEPADLWTSRLPRKWLDVAPRPQWVESRGESIWMLGDIPVSAAGQYSVAGWPEFIPSRPRKIEEADPACWDPAARLQRMDEYGIHAQVLYPNLIGFCPKDFITYSKQLGEPDWAIACVAACNDFQAEFASQDPTRLVPLMMLPFWDMDAALLELDRSMDTGHKGVILTAQFERLNIGLPSLWDPHWAPLLSAISERGLSINFHIGFSENTGKDLVDTWAGSNMTSADRSGMACLSFLANARVITEVICSGLCHDYPGIDFVSVESGASWLPFLIEGMDWNWKNYGASKDFPDRELPSFYFRRQFYGSFWFERDAVSRLVDLYADNLMFETDFPHPISLSPGPTSAAENPRKMAETALAGQSDDVIRKVLHDNAARVYHLDPLVP
jgi:predicted TIM-barrel fold metal-dependent hydrolase